jgi:mannose-6-phosphate isomerase
MKAKTKISSVSQTVLYPLQFEPIYQYWLWGGRHLADLLTAPMQDDDPKGEVWIQRREDY